MGDRAFSEFPTMVFLSYEVPKPVQIQGQVKRIQGFLVTKVDFVTFCINNIEVFVKSRAKGMKAHS